MGWFWHIEGVPVLWGENEEVKLNNIRTLRAGKIW